MSRPFEVVFQNSHGREGDLTRVTVDGRRARRRRSIGSRVFIHDRVAIVAIDFGFTIDDIAVIGAVGGGVMVVVVGDVVVVVVVDMIGSSWMMVIPSPMVVIVIVVGLAVVIMATSIIFRVVILVTTTVVVTVPTVVQGPRGVGGRAEDGAGLGRLAITGTTETRGQAGAHHTVPPTHAVLLPMVRRMPMPHRGPHRRWHRRRRMRGRWDMMTAGWGIDTDAYTGYTSYTIPGL